VTRQLSLLSADVATPVVDDLDGLLCGPGHVVQQASEARISVLVPTGWRQLALERRLAVLGLSAPSVAVAGTTRSDAVSVRTRFDAQLLPLARRWIRGASPVVPRPLVLDAARLWWWAVAGGSGDGVGYRLQLATSTPQRWDAIGSALSEAGLPGIFLGPRADGPAYRLVGTRRLARLADLLGEPPAGAGPTDWPG
jgi:hypothetical protein